MSDDCKYTPEEVRRMKHEVANLKALLAEEQDPRRREELQNRINGLEISISGCEN